MAPSTHADPTPLPVQPGDILAGKYRVERVLGRGGMGLVVAAMHIQLEQLVALKFLLPDAMKNPEVVGRFAREARAAVKLQSQHVARVSDVGTLETGAPFMVMECLEGHDLSKTLDKDGALDVQQAVDYVLQACEAIAEAHALGIVHRDLKPSNLFLAKRSDKRRIIKVLDFGISKTVGPGAAESDGALTRTTDVLGSPMYMSPEQLRSSRAVDARTDIWSLGVILFELLTVEVPFQVGTLAEICGAILHEQPKHLRDLRDDVPEELDDVVARCLEKDPNMRFATVAELAVALEPFGSDAAAASVTQIERFGPAGTVPAEEDLRATALERRSGAVTTGSGVRSAIRQSSALRPRPAASTSQKATATTWDKKPSAVERSSTPWIASGVLLLGLVGFGVWRLGFAKKDDAPEAATTTVAAPPPPTATATAAASATASAAPSAAPSATASAAPTAEAAETAAPEPEPPPSAAHTSAPIAKGGAAPRASASGSANAKAPTPASTLAAAIASWGVIKPAEPVHAPEAAKPPDPPPKKPAEAPKPPDAPK